MDFGKQEAIQARFFVSFFSVVGWTTGMLNSLIKTRVSQSEASRARSTGSQEEHFVWLTYWNEPWTVYEGHCHWEFLKRVINGEKSPSWAALWNLREFQRRRKEGKKAEGLLVVSVVKSLPARPLSTEAPGGPSTLHKKHSTPVIGPGTWFCSVCWNVTWTSVPIKVTPD